ncbi:MAG TPA: ATP-binding protein [Thioploca sp.]|nr:ATP-binding protein [Thioploca sp.]
MTHIFGDFKDCPPNTQEYFMFGFSPHSKISFKELWETNGLLADFFTNYLTIFYRDRDTQALKEDVSFIANELLENARKFNDQTAKDPIKVQFQLYNDRLILCVMNSVPTKNVDGFQSFLPELLRSNPHELFRRQIEQGKKAGSTKASKLGLQTIIKDYEEATLGWKFDKVKQSPEKIVVTTMVQLAIG